MADNTKKLVDDIFVVAGEMIPQNGEDSFLSIKTDDAAIVGCFDGCGGLGARKFAEFNNKTGAYLASRVVSGAVSDWFKDQLGNNTTDKMQMSENIVEYIMRGYRNVLDFVKEESYISGSMVRELPTTAAIAYVKQEEDNIYLYAFWAGDSRVYMIDNAGFAQISVDDIEGEDAFTNLLNDAPMNNVLSSDGKFTLHAKKCLINAPVTVFVATDGCFGYLPTPMDFEYVLENIVAESRSKEDMLQAYDEFYNNSASDDYTLGIMNIGYGDYETFRDRMISLKDDIKTNYIDKITDRNNMELLSSLWKQYKSNYERKSRWLDD